MKDMTIEEARTEAVRRWGARAEISFRSPRLKANSRGRLGRYSCTVCAGQGGGYGTIVGQGNTWREAFADACAR